MAEYYCLDTRRDIALSNSNITCTSSSPIFWAVYSSPDHLMRELRALD